MSASQEQMPHDETDIKESFREKFTQLTEELREKVGGVIESATETVATFKKSVEIGFALVTKGAYAEGPAYEIPELGSSMETLMQPMALSKIYDKFPTGPGGRMYGFGEVNYAQPLPAERLIESPIESYWQYISVDRNRGTPDNYYEMGQSFLKEMQQRGYSPEQVGKMIARELPTRIEESFKEACEIQVQLERALISGASYEDVQDIIKQRNEKARLAYLMNGNYKGPGTGNYGWAAKGNAAYKEGMENLILELETKEDEYAGRGKNALVEKTRAKLQELHNKLENPVNELNLYHYEDYHGSADMYAVTLRYKVGATLDKHPFKKKESLQELAEDTVEIPSYPMYAYENKII